MIIVTKMINPIRDYHVFSRPPLARFPYLD